MYSISVHYFNYVVFNNWRRLWLQPNNLYHICWRHCYMILLCSGLSLQSEWVSTQDSHHTNRAMPDIENIKWFELALEPCEKNIDIIQATGVFFVFFCFFNTWRYYTFVKFQVHFLPWELVTNKTCILNKVEHTLFIPVSPTSLIYCLLNVSKLYIFGRNQLWI
jgi:hypothetical protein